MAPLAQGNWGAPLLNFSQLAQIPDQYYKARAMNAFADGVPTNPDGSPNYAEILKKGAQAGGLDFVKGIMPYIYMSCAADDPKVAAAIGQIAGGGSPTSSAAPQQQTAAAPAHPAGAGPDNIAPQRTTRITGSGTEDDPFVIPNEGGYRFFQASDNYPKGSHWTIANTGWSGIKGQAGATRSGAGPTPPLGKVAASAREQAPESGQPTAGPENTAEGQTVSSGPGTPGGGMARATPEQIAAARQRLMQGISGGDGGGVSGAPGPVATPGGPVPQVGRGGTAVPVPGMSPPTGPPPATPPVVPPAAAPPQTPTRPGVPDFAPYQAPARPPLPSFDPATDNPDIQKLRAQANQARQAAALLGMHNPNHLRDKAIDTFNQRVTELEKQAESKAETLRKPFEKLNEARAQGFRSVQAKEAFDKAIEKANEAGVRQLEAINGAASQTSVELEPHILLGKALANSGSLYTGWGAETVMQLNKAKQLYGDQGAATPQEAFQKTVAAMQLGMANMQRFMAQMGGQQAARLFAAQINLIGQSSASVHNTVAGNRLLMENGYRAAQKIYEVQELASKYIAAGHPYLDQEFNQKVVEYLRSHPLMNELESSNPAKFMSAPQVPKAIADAGPAALRKWQHDVGAKPGDPIRKADGSGYFKALTFKKQE